MFGMDEDVDRVVCKTDEGKGEMVCTFYKDKNEIGKVSIKAPEYGPLEFEIDNVKALTSLLKAFR